MTEWGGESDCGRSRLETVGCKIRFWSGKLISLIHLGLQSLYVKSVSDRCTCRPCSRVGKRRHAWSGRGAWEDQRTVNELQSSLCLQPFPSIINLIFVAQSCIILTSTRRLGDKEQAVMLFATKASELRSTDPWSGMEIMSYSTICIFVIVMKEHHFRLEKQIIAEF